MVYDFFLSVQKICCILPSMMKEEHIRTIIKQNEQLHQVIGDMARTLKVICDVVCENLSPVQPISDPDPDLPKAYDEKDLITIKEAMHIMNVSRWKIDKLRKEHKLTTTERK